MCEGEYEAIEGSKKGRHRKKQLYNTILRQMEFYFSDSNLSKDRFLSLLIAKNPYIDVELFFKFNKIRKLNCSIDDIRKAIGKSDLIELSDDGKQICRKKPIKLKDNVDECTIYVENIKADANHDWLNQVFSDFGNVVYVSIPKYKYNKGNKGFAFVEFETEKEAQNALDYFESINCKMPSETNPENLRSITTYEETVKTYAESENNEKMESENLKKRKLSFKSEKPDKKMKCAVSSETQADNEAVIDKIQHEDSDIKRKRKTKKDKKKTYIKELGLQILSKREWKKMRNRYLDLQRKKMKEYKLYLTKSRDSKKKIDQFKKNQEDSITSEESKSVEQAPVKLEYMPGVIVKLQLSESCMDVKKLKNDIKTLSPDVKYVDVPLPAGNEEVFVRFSNSESAKYFCNQDFSGKKTILEHEEEALYWTKIQNDRNVKFTKSVKKQRGREKLLKKAEKERAKHIRFDEGE